MGTNRFSPQAAAMIAALALAGCAGGMGNWGFGGNPPPEQPPPGGQPFVIGQGPTGGVMMYLADQSQLQELRLKGGPGGKNYIGPPGPTPGPQDREIVQFDGRVMLMVFVEPEIAGRYGTGVYVRCAPSAGAVAKKK